MNHAYLVTGIWRSGTSMMMRCLEASGIDVVFDKDQDISSVYPRSEYHPNPNGYYHPLEERFDDPDFFNLIKGKAIKCEWKRLVHKFHDGKYRVIFMKRNPSEIVKSMMSFDKYGSFGDHEIAAYLYDQVVPEYLKKIQTDERFDVIEVDYNQVMDDPKKAFLELERWGLKTDIMKKLVDNNLYRSRA